MEIDNEFLLPNSCEGDKEDGFRDVGKITMLTINGPAFGIRKLSMNSGFRRVLMEEMQHDSSSCGKEDTGVRKDHDGR